MALFGFLSTPEGRARRKARKDEKRTSKRIRKDDRRTAKTIRIKTRNDAKTERVRTRQVTKLGVKTAQAEADKVAYENGVQPIKHGFDNVVDNVGSILSNLVGGGGGTAYTPGPAPDVSAGGSVDFGEDVNIGGFKLSPLVIIGGIAAALFLGKKRR